jgi:uncharacterized membrane protein
MTDARKPDPVARLLFFLPLLFIGLAVLASVLALPYLPERMPIHWGADGQPTRMASRNAAVILPIVFMVHAWLLVGLVGWAVTKSNGAGGMSPRVMPTVTSGVIGMLVLLHLATLANGLGWKVPIPLVAVAGTGALFVLMGYKMRDIPPNPLFGVRTPTTLRSPAAWRRANDVGGKGFIYAGVATMLAAPLPPSWALTVMLGSILLAGAAGIIAGRRAEGEGPEHA